MVLGSTNQRGISVEPRHNQGLARRLRLAKGGALMGSGCVGFHTRIGRLILTCFAGFLLLYPVDGWGDEAPIDGAAGLRSDDWITINKDYSSQRYVDLDQITPKNVGKLKEICEIGLNEPTVFSTGLLKVGRTLYVDTAHLTVAFDAATCDLHWRFVVPVRQRPIGANNRGPAYLAGKIFRGTNDGHLIALDANTGRLLWDVHPTVQDPDNGKLETFISAPIAWAGESVYRHRPQRLSPNWAADGLRCQYRQQVVELRHHIGRSRRRRLLDNLLARSQDRGDAGPGRQPLPGLQPGRAGRSGFHQIHRFRHFGGCEHRPAELVLSGRSRGRP